MNLEFTLEEVALIYQLVANIGGAGQKRVVLDSIYDKLYEKFHIDIHEFPFEGQSVYLSSGPVTEISVRASICPGGAPTRS